MKAILIGLGVGVLALYALDCSAMQTPAQAMTCCGAMPCAPHGHQSMQDCCKTMPSMHAPFVPPQTFADDFSFAAAPAAVLTPASISANVRVDLPGGMIAAQCHAPPIASLAALAPLRI